MLPTSLGEALAALREDTVLVDGFGEGFVSYYAKAADNDAVAGAKTTTSDIYFVQIRPFKKDYKPAQSMAICIACSWNNGTPSVFRSTVSSAGLGYSTVSLPSRRLR